MRRRLAALAILVVAITGCGGSSHANSRPALIVSAASSLRNAFADS